MDLPRSRGRHLVTADRGFATGSGLIARLFAPGIERVLDRIDAGLAEGAIEATLPDGRSRRLGGHAPGPVAIVHLDSWRALFRLATTGSVGWYRAWAEGEWTSPDPVPLFDLFMRNRHSLGNSARSRGIWRLAHRAAHVFRDNDRHGARANIAFHYDLGNDFYGAWLDPSMTYSAAMFDHPAEPLERAQHRKIRALLNRLDLRPGQHLLEIGCGWGSLAEIAARDYDVRVTALTLSAEQKAHADARLARAGLGDRVTIALTDYRDVRGRFDAIASVEMVEALGQRWWPAFMQAVAGALKPGGRAGSGIL